MRVVVAPDKFKGSLSAPDAARAIARGVASVAPRAVVDLAPMADGGDGTVEALVSATGGEFRRRDAAAGCTDDNDLAAADRERTLA